MYKMFMNSKSITYQFNEDEKEIIPVYGEGYL